MNRYNLAEILPEELFDEINKKPSIKLRKIETSLFEGNSFLGVSYIDLFLGEDSTYYVLQSQQEPIGDYGSHWIDCWYKCNDNKKVEELLLNENLQY